MAYLITYQKYRAFDSSGNPLSGGKVYTYESGTTTPKTTYTDSGEGTPNDNPVILNARGEADIWLNGSYTIVLKDSDDVQIDSQDNIAGIGSLTDVLDQWIDSGLTPTYVSATSFTLSGDQTSDFEVGRRIKSTNSGGTVYSTIVTSSYSDPSTTVTTVNDASASLDSGLSAVSLSILSVTSQAYPYRELILPQTTTHNIAADASYTLTDAQNIYGRIVITDTGTLLTGAVNIVVSDDVRGFVAQNDTLYTLTFKTSAGTGIAVDPGRASTLLCDGTNVEKKHSSSEEIYADTVQSPTSGTSVSFTPPSWAKKVTIVLDQITTTVATLGMTLGTGGSSETSGYSSTHTRLSDQPATLTGSIGANSFIVMAVSSGTPVISGTIELTLLDSSTNTWAVSINTNQNNGTYNYTFVSSGTKSLAGALDIIEVSGGTFSAGKINALYQ